MNEQSLLYVIASLFQMFSDSTLPTQTFEVSSVEGRTITLKSNLEGNYFAGMVTVVSGNGAGISYPIAYSDANKIICNTFFSNPALKLVDGDTVSVSMEPIKGTKIFVYEPDAVRKNSSSDYIITIDASGFTESLNDTTGANFGAARRPIQNIVAKYNTVYPITVTVEAPGSVADTDDIQTDVETIIRFRKLCSVTTLIIQKLRNISENNIRAMSDIECVYMALRRTGSAYTKQGGIIDFQVTVR